MKIYLFLERSECRDGCEDSEEVVELLLDKGADVNFIDNDRRSALDVAIEVNKNEGKFKQDRGL